MPHTSSKPLRLLVVCPSWLGDALMATPALRLLRRSLPGSFIGGLVRPGLDELLAGTDFFDELHVDRARGVMGPKLVAAKLRPRRYDAALLLTNSFSTALITRLAFIPRRIGYERDGRGLLLTDKLHAPRRARPHRGWAPVSAVEYYLAAARVLLPELSSESPHAAKAPGTVGGLELAVTPQQQQDAWSILEKTGIGIGDRNHILNDERPAGTAGPPKGIEPGDRFAVLNPGGNNPAKRWPAERFGEVGAYLIRRHGLRVLINGSPGEIDVVRAVTESIRAHLGSDAVTAGLDIGELPNLGVTIGSLKEIIRRSSLMVTNDTGPRHIAAAFAIPTIALFGPTDPRWTTLPDSSLWRSEQSPSPIPPSRELMLLADPTLPSEEVADDHPERCRIERIGVDQVVAAIDALLSRNTAR